MATAAIVTASTALDLSDPLPLDSGQQLQGARIAYETYGTLSPSADNAVLVCHATTGDQHVASPHPKTGKPGWWSRMVGPGKPIDTDRFFVICTNILGSCMGSSGPSSIAPDGRPYGMRFPVLTIRDMVRAQVALLDHLGIDRLYAVAGGSMGGNASSGTNVNLVVTGLIGAAFAAAFYLALYPFRKTYLGVLFYERGWVQYALALLMGWSAAILLFKWRKLRSQRASMLFDLLPTEVSPTIDVASVPRFTQHIRSLPVPPHSSFLINRVLRGLEHFRVRKSHGEVAGLLATQSEIDATAADSSYSFVKVCIWAIPILGFIGTVQGISDAVAGFSGSLETAKEISVLKESLNEITTGLAVAFDTTLVALVMSLLVMFPMSALQKAEEDLLNWVDEYCNENLLKRLHEDLPANLEADAEGKPRPRPAWEADDEIRAAVHHAMAGEQGQMLQLVQSLASRVAELQNRQVGELDKAIVGITDRAERTQDEIARSLMESSSRVQKYFESLERSIASLNVALHYLGERQVVIQSPRRSWWPFGRRGGGNGE